MQAFVRLSDIFFIIGILILAITFLNLISGMGGFTGLRYLWYWLTAGILKRDINTSRKDYYTFRLEESEKRNSTSVMKKIYIILTITGTVCILISLVFAII